jgi:hypothetical protein
MIDDGVGGDAVGRPSVSPRRLSRETSRSTETETHVSGHDPKERAKDDECLGQLELDMELPEQTQPKTNTRNLSELEMFKEKFRKPNSNNNNNQCNEKKKVPANATISTTTAVNDNETTRIEEPDSMEIELENEDVQDQDDVLKTVRAVAIDEEAYRQEILRQAQLQKEQEDDDSYSQHADGQMPPAPLVHAVATEEMDEKEIQLYKRRRYMYIGIALASVLLLIATVVGAVVGITANKSADEPVPPFSDFCLQIVGFYAMEEPRFDCKCTHETNVVHCQGDFDRYYSAVVLQYDETSGSYYGGDCFCSDYECPTSSTECFTAYSKDDTNCVISESLPANSSLCKDGSGCVLCDSEEYFTFNTAQCGFEGSTCMESHIPKPQYLQKAMLQSPNTPVLQPSSSFEDFCTRITTSYQAKGYTCQCYQDDPDYQDNRGDNQDHIGCYRLDTHHTDVVSWDYEESSILGTHCICPDTSCEESPILCTNVLYDFVSDRAGCNIFDLDNDEGLQCGGSECSVCADDESVDFFRVDANSCDGAGQCRPTELFFF